MEGRVGIAKGRLLLTVVVLAYYRPYITVGKQSDQDRCVTDIAVVGCLNRHASVGKWAYAKCPQLLPGTLEPSVTLVTFWVYSYDANHCATETRHNIQTKKILPVCCCNCLCMLITAAANTSMSKALRDAVLDAWRLPPSRPSSVCHQWTKPLTGSLAPPSPVVRWNATGRWPQQQQQQLLRVVSVALASLNYVTDAAQFST